VGSLDAGDFLRMWADWLRAGRVGGKAPSKDAVDPLTWRSLALQVHAARFYE